MPALSPSPAAPKLTGSVGRGGTNRPADVRAVQELLNRSLGQLTPLAEVPENGQCTAQTVTLIEAFQRRVVKAANPDARVDPHGRTLDALVTCAGGATYAPHVAPPKPAAEQKFTDSTLERTTRRTTPSAHEVVQLLLTVWPDLRQQGARTLTAQFMAETGDGRFCFNWNLGNVKAKAGDVHMYLRGVWECDSEGAVKASIAASVGLAALATAEQRKRNGECAAGKVQVVYQPPHPQCRFRAYDSLADGAARWMAHHQRIAQANMKYLPALVAGDVPAVAKALKQARYYTADEARYASLMTAKKQRIDRELGPA